MLIDLDPKNTSHRAAVARLHYELLPGGPVAGLGMIFLESFFYKYLIQGQLIRCSVYQHEGQIVGFITYTDDPLGFMSKGRRRYFWQLLFVLVLSLLQNPIRIHILWKLATRSKKRTQQEETEVGELLSLGVLKEFQRIKTAEKPISVAKELLNHSLVHYEQLGYKKVNADVRTNNKGAILFYSSCGREISVSDSDELEDNVVVSILLKD